MNGDLPVSCIVGQVGRNEVYLQCACCHPRTMMLGGAITIQLADVPVLAAHQRPGTGRARSLM